MHLSQNLLLMLGGDHSADDVMPGENPVASKESTNANHQPSSSVVPGGGRLALTKPVDGPNDNGKKKPST
ncbi:hypothetical protein HID58_024644 [Brassica napus]|uniref:Uncharacterized protein n=1 Tax=Brassica napus TaxID=3708 RepID=A0ABQ8CIR8_BRANA|nr:hypothetical protein HID58_024644 [Brassica napus]